MQVPDGKQAVVATRVVPGAPASGFRAIDAGGMAHSKVADQYWTSVPTAPADDRTPRFLYPPTTAATLNLAAVAAQAARIWHHSDPAFAARALAAARRAWAAAERNPDIPASSDFTGSGGYGDDDPRDERFWAAAELFVTTGEAPFGAIVEHSVFLTHPSARLNWRQVDQAGLMALATLPNSLPAHARSTARAALLNLAKRRLALRQTNAYRLPIAGAAFGWGSNADLLNQALLFGVAWQIDPQPEYRTAALDVVDYLLGRNALDRSFVTGFGARPMTRPHHRFWAHAADPRYPLPPPGVLSGGPNATAMTDSVSSRLKGHCVGQTCWADDWRAFTMNEVAINWNAPLVWVCAFLDATEDRHDAAPPT
jgi:endoglucanase